MEVRCGEGREGERRAGKENKKEGRGGEGEGKGREGKEKGEGREKEKEGKGRKKERGGERMGSLERRGVESRDEVSRGVGTGR